MQLKPETLRKIVVTIPVIAKPEKIEASGELLDLYVLDDITLTLREDGSLYGLIFDVLSKDFVVLSDGTLLIGDISGKTEPSVVADPEVINLIEEFIDWRMRLVSLLESRHALS